MRDMLYNWPGHEQSERHIMLSLIIAESKLKEGIRVQIYK